MNRLTGVGLNPSEFPEEYEKYKSNVIKWKNKTAWAREYLKRKEQLDGSERANSRRASQRRALCGREQGKERNR
jgi:hypothetical protein